VRKSQSRNISGGVWKVFRVFGTKREQEGKARITFKVQKGRRMAIKTGGRLQNV